MKNPIHRKTRLSASVFDTTSKTHKAAGISACALAIYLTECLKSSYAGQGAVAALVPVAERGTLKSPEQPVLTEQEAIEAIIVELAAKQKEVDGLSADESIDVVESYESHMTPAMESHTGVSGASVLVGGTAVTEEASTTSPAWLGFGLIVLGSGIAVAATGSGGSSTDDEGEQDENLEDSEDDVAVEYQYKNKNIDLYNRMELDGFRITGNDETVLIPTQANDIWGYSDGENEYALVGVNNGTVIVNVTTPEEPVYMAFIVTKSPEHVDHESNNESDEELPGGSAHHHHPSKACHHPEGGCEDQDSVWADLKCLDEASFCYGVSEEDNYGLLVINMKELIAAAQDYLDTHNAPLFIQESTHSGIVSYKNEFGNAHNLRINEETYSLYVVGSTSISPETGCSQSAGLLIYDLISEPDNPQFVGCYEGDSAHPNYYYHDITTQVYQGPDRDYHGHEIIIASGGEIDPSRDQYIVILDAGVRDLELPKPEIMEIATIYDSENFVYVHQGDFSSDQRYYFHDDEQDEDLLGVGTTTFVYDISDLDQPSDAGLFVRSDDTATDHNQYVVGSCVFQSNYASGLLVYRESFFTENFEEGVTVHTSENDLLAYFDTTPEDHERWIGSWSNYPYFANENENGAILVSDIYGGLFILELDDEILRECDLQI